VKSGSSIGLFAFMLGTCLLGCGDDGSGPPDAGPPPEEQCINAMDQAVIAPLTPDGGVDAGLALDPLSEYFANCSRDTCLEASFSGTDEELAACMDTCIDATAVSGLSSGCRTCYYEQVVCVRENCITVCAVATSDACLTCLAEDCAPRLRDCRGF